MRKTDRDRNGMDFPRLFYPELYLLEGGYRAFFVQHPVRSLGVGVFAVIYPMIKDALFAFKIGITFLFVNATYCMLTVEMSSSLNIQSSSIQNFQSTTVAAYLRAYTTPPQSDLPPFHTHTHTHIHTHTNTHNINNVYYGIQRKQNKALVCPTSVTCVPLCVGITAP